MQAGEDVATAAAARTLLARAYATDPLIRWLFPETEHRLDSSAAWLGLFVEHYLRGGGQVDIVGPAPLTALAAWRLPAPVRPVAAPALPTLAGLLTALVGTARASELGAALSALGALRPAGPYAYLHFLAVDPDEQGRGSGSALLRHGLARQAGTGLGAYLETTNPRNLEFYAAAGFTVQQTVALAAGGPTVWAMGRPPD